MNRKRQIAILLLLALSLAAGADQALAQQPGSQSKDARASARSGDEIQLSKLLLAKARPKRRPSFSLMPQSRYPNLTGSTFSITPATAPGPPVTGTGTLGRLTKWGGFTNSNSAIGDSNIYEDKFGMVGIGTDSPTSKLTVMGLIESAGAAGGVKFTDGSVQTTAFDPNQAVRSLRGLRGDLFLAAGANITIAPSGGNTLTIAAPNSLTSVFHNATLAGIGSAASPLGIADGGVGTMQLADNSVTAAKILPGQAVKSVNNLKDDVTLAAGSGITITSSSNTLTVAASATSVSHDASLRGNGTGAMPLGVNVPLSLIGLTDQPIINASNNGSGPGLRGISGDGAHSGVEGLGLTGVKGTATAGGVGVLGIGGSFSGFFVGPVNIEGTLFVTGTKHFVEPHPTDPTRMISYVCLEGREAGTYFRGSGRIVNGSAVIEVPEDFRIVSDEKGLTVQVTPMGDPATIWCVAKSLDKIELRASADVEFDYTVNGVRRMFKNQSPIVENTVFLPLLPDDDLSRIRNPEAVRRLKASGILNEDGSVNLETVQKLDAYKRRHNQQ